MKKYIKSFLCAVLTLLFIFGLNPTPSAAEDVPTVKVAMSEDESIIVERILYTALKRLGYQMVTKTAGMRTTVNDVNYGDAAIVPAQTIGLENDYPNLIRIPVPISYVETNVYTRSEEPYEFTSWDNLTGLRLSHCWKNLYITKNVPRANASEVVTLNEYEDLWDSLLAGETDVAVIPNLTGYVRIVPEGVKMAGVIEREPRYTYVNKDYEYLVPLLTDAYQEMTDGGTMEMIRTSSQAGEKKVVLHISSYSTRVEWERNEIDAIRKSLEAIPNVEYHNLNLNARQVHNKANINAIVASTIRTNFIERNPDIIIASDNDALEFVLNYYYMIFPKVPVVFCGVNNFDESMLHGFEEYVTGVTETVSFKETITEMLRMYPAVKRIYILNDYTQSGIKWRECLQACINKNDFPVEYEFSGDKPFADILTDISGFGSDTLVLLGTYFLDNGNAFYAEQEVQEQVRIASQNPVFCLADSFNGYGSLGGMVSSSEAQGSAAGSMVKEILEGKNISEIPIVLSSSSLNHWQFDYSVAEKFKINTKNLPAEHVALNRRLSVYESNPFEFWIALTLIISFSVIIAGLTVFVRMMRQKNKNLLEIQKNLHTAEELLEKDDDLRKMINSLPVPVLIADEKTSALEYGNQAFLTVNGFNSFEQAKLLDLTPVVEKASDLWEGKSVSFAYGKLIENEKEPDNEICQRISAEKLTYSDKNCFVFISEDITAQLKETEMLSRAAQKEKEANMLKSRFLANMSHEIRTPMNAIIGLSQLALLKRQTSENEGFFQKIGSSAKNLLSIISDILDFSKIEAEKLDLAEEEFLLEDTISSAFMVAVDRVENKPLEMILDIHSDIPCRLYGDSTRLWQVLKNILDNAVKYTSAGQVLMIVEKAETPPETGKISLCFRISDTGMGMNPGQLSRLFTPFEQLHQTDFKSKIAGTGLGMSITKQLVGLMNGSVEVKSKEGKGTEFSVTIPFKLSEDGKTFRDVSLEYAEKAEKAVESVLLISKNADLLRIMERFFKETGVKSAVASYVGAAADIINNEQDEVFRTILIDVPPAVDIPPDGESGLESTKKIIEHCGGARVLLLTDYLKRFISPQLLNKAGVSDIIEKPFTISAFAQKVFGSKTDTLPQSVKRARYSEARVLLCEDIEINQMIADSMLSEFGISATIASNGQEALELLETDTFDLIFMDIIMPVMDGHEATIAIRQSGKPYKDIPICALTANVMVDEVQKCISEGINAHLEKPLDIDALAVVLADMLAHLAD